jgi:UDP-N-acetylglucosamine 2-epimerase
MDKQNVGFDICFGCNYIFSHTYSQNEWYFYNETEWIELVKSNGACPVGTNADNIIATFQNRNTVSADFSKKLYGNGNAGSIIVEQLLQLI